MKGTKMEDNESIGEILRRIREEKGIPLEEVVRITKVRETYLRAIEENNKFVLPGEAYYRAFLKSYAEFLGIDYEELKKKYSDLESEKKSSKKAQSEQNKKALQDEKDLQKIKIQTIFDKIFGNKFVRVLLVLLLFALFIYSISSDSSKNEEITEEAVIENSQKNDDVKSAEVKVDTTSSLDTTELITKNKYLNLSLLGIETTWVRIKVDNDDVYEVYVKPDEERKWKAKNKFELKINNAGGVKVKLNNKLIKPLGKRGEAIEKVVFSREKQTK